MQQEGQEENSSYEGEEPSEHEGEGKNGFMGMGDPVDEAKKKRAREESEESKALKKEIIKLVSRYPSLELRTSKVIMEKLNEMGEDELKIVRDNCVNDLSELRGTPVSSFVLFCVTSPVDWKLPGYTEQCLSDVELKRDVETEMISLFGDLSTRINIFFRLLNNAYITWKRSRPEGYSEYAPTRKQEPNEQGEPSTDGESDIAAGFSKSVGKGKTPL